MLTSSLPRFASRARYPRSAPAGYNAAAVAKAYGLPSSDGAGITVGVIELGGAYNAADMAIMGLKSSVTCINVAGAHPSSSDADGEVMLDIEVIAEVAPAAAIRVYFASNTDDGFAAAIAQAAAECQIVSISWGGPESSWTRQAVRKFETVLAGARARGVPVFVASGDTGSRDGTSRDTADYPASSPSAIGCGGTRLDLDPATGARVSEVAWNDDPNSSATGGGVSRLFPGRTVPDVAGCGDPESGYLISVDGQKGVIGGTSAVAPLYAACTAVVMALYGKPFDLLNTILTNPAICFDVTQGNNGGFKAGVGKDDVSGFGVVNWGALLAVLTSGTQIPAPGGGTGSGTGTGGTTPPSGGTGGGDTSSLLSDLYAELTALLAKIKAALGGKSG